MILKEGRNCRQLTPAHRVSFLVDAAAYFEAFTRAARQAQREILILGWDLDTRICLFENRRPVRLGAFFKELVTQNEELQIYILTWDYSWIYWRERQPRRQILKEFAGIPRIHFKLDPGVVFVASQHQKVVAIDGQIAFVGGLDLTQRRWDTPRHAPDEPRRLDPEGSLYAPFHDVQTAVTGPAAGACRQVFVDRWLEATGQQIVPLSPAFAGAGDDASRFESGISAHIKDVDVALARTLPRRRGKPGVYEIESLYIDSLKSATNYVYIENQYLTSRKLRDTLIELLACEQGPEVIIVLPCQNSGWFEIGTMGHLRAKLLQKLQTRDRFNRLKVYFPTLKHDHGNYLNLHSKVQIVDDKFVHIGSANMSNRSLGLDSECDLAIESNGRKDVESAIRALRDRLLAEHLGLSALRVSETIRERGSVLRAVEELRTKTNTLHFCPVKVNPWLCRFLPRDELIDPTNEVDFEHHLSSFKRRIIIAGVFIVSIVFLIKSQSYGEDVLAQSINEVRTYFVNSARSPFNLIAGTSILLLLFVPFNAVALGLSLVCSPLQVIYAGIGGALISASVVFGIARKGGRFLIAIGTKLSRRPFFQRFKFEERAERVNKLLGSRGILTVSILRATPIAPFWVLNILMGISPVRFDYFVIGNVIGLLPGLILIALFGSQTQSFARNPSLLGLIGPVLIIGVFFMISKWTKRFMRKEEFGG